MRQSACLVFNPIMVDNCAAILNCTPVGRASDSWGRSFLSVAWPTGVQPVFFCFAPELVSYLAPWDLHRRAAYSISESSFLIHHGIMIYLFVYDDSLTS